MIKLAKKKKFMFRIPNFNWKLQISGNILKF